MGIEKAWVLEGGRVTRVGSAQVGVSARRHGTDERTGRGGFELYEDVGFKIGSAFDGRLGDPSEEVLWGGSLLNLDDGDESRDVIAEVRAGVLQASALAVYCCCRDRGDARGRPWTWSTCNSPFSCLFAAVERRTYSSLAISTPPASVSGPSSPPSTDDARSPQVLCPSIPPAAAGTCCSPPIRRGLLVTSTASSDCHGGRVIRRALSGEVQLERGLTETERSEIVSLAGPPPIPSLLYFGAR